MKRIFKGVWIPADIWMDTDLSWAEKLYLLEIDTLDDGEVGCYASNKYLGEFFNQSPQRAASIIRQLEQKNRIVLEYEGKKRYIKVIDGSLKNDVTLRAAEEKTEEASKDSELKTTLRNLFFKLYNYKVRSVSGRMLRDDGKPIYPAWSGKEGSLLKSDFEQHGFQELKRMMLLFFADQVQAVSDFTRYKEKAGYGYTVFHGSITKLQATGFTPREPCWECGAWDFHYPECSHTKIKEEKQRAEFEEIQEAKEEFAGNLTEMFKDKIKKRK